LKTPSLSKGVVKAIQAAVDKVFDKAVARFLARPPVDKRIYIGIKPRVTLPSLFEAASAEERAKADKSILERLLDVAQGFVDAQREVTKARVVKAVGSWLAEAHAKGEETTEKDVEDVLGVQLYDVMRQAKDGMHKIVAAESNTAKNLGVLDGIVKVNAASGIDDPVVYFVVVRDDVLCDECKRLHLLDDGVTPRVWYLSEVGHGYHKKGQENPKLGGLHPHCRCSLVSLMPGYGFNGAGGVTYVKLGHDEMAKQRGVKKSEPDVSVEIEDLPEINAKLLAADLEPLLGPDGRMVVGTNDDFKSFAKSVGDGVFVAFRGSKTDLSKEALHKLVPDAVQAAAPNARIFARGKTFKVFVASQDLADTVVAAIQSAVLEGDG